MGPQILLVLVVVGLAAAMWFGVFDASAILSSVMNLVGDPANPESPIYDQVASTLIANMALIVVGLAAWFIMKWLGNAKNKFILVGILIGVLLITVILPSVNAA